MTLTARPTTYKGIQMRSRLEALFAAELDALGAEWVYEPRAYAGDGGQYLPDFQILTSPQQQPYTRPYFIEVRPTVEGAFRAMPQMQVILESLPDAILHVVVWPDDLSWVRHQDGTWRSSWRPA